MLKNLLFFGFMFLWPIFSTIIFLMRKKDRFVKGISDEDLAAFKKLFGFVTIFVAGLICIFSVEGPSEPFKADLIIEIFCFDILSALFLLIAGKWMTGLLGVIFFPSHMAIATNILLDDFIPQGLIILCVLLYPITSWIQFQQTVIPLEKLGVKGD